MYTQCPECLTIYEIDEDALQASLGIVRCGRCEKRFDALRTLSDTLPIEPLEPLPEQNPAGRAPTLTEAVPPSTIERAARKSRPKNAGIASTPSETPEPRPATSTGRSADDWFTGLESELTAASIPDPQDAPAPDDDNWSVELADETGSDGPGEEIDDTRVTPVEEDVEPREASQPAWLDETVQPDPAPEGDPDAPSLDSGPVDADAESIADPREPAGDAAADAGTDPPPVDASFDSMPADVEPEDAAPAPIYVRPRRHFSRAGAAWALGCVLLALLLAMQVAWAKRIDLLRNPVTQGWMARVCRNIPCNLPLIRDTAKLELLSRDVRPDPNVAGALTITATVRNDAAFSQPWPVVVVVLNDLDNNPVAMRRFRPAEYMTDPARRAAGMAAGATAVVAFEVADPGKRAVAFQFGFE